MNTKKGAVSQTVEINSLAQERIRKGLPVYNLGAGEPIIDAFLPVKQAGIRAINENKTLYPPVAGLFELRNETAKWLNFSYGTRLKSENILVTNGGKLGIYLALQALLKKGDEVIIPSPFWVSYPSIVSLFSGKPKIVRTLESNGWKITAEQLRRTCGLKTKILILNNASNPTGALYCKQELRALLEVAEEKNLLVISDEVYSSLVYDGKTFISCGAFHRFSKRVIILQSCSKNFAMTGWRVGFVCAGTDIIKTLTTLLSQSTSGATTISQWAALDALKNANDITAKIRKEMGTRRDILVGLLEKNFSVRLNKPESSLYLFLNLKNIGINTLNSELFCKQLLQKTGVIAIPGIAFGKEGYIRLSYSARPDTIKKAIKLLRTYLG